MIKIKELLCESGRASLFHGVKLEYADQILDKNMLEGYSVQRWWPDGKRRKENDPKYEKSFWMKGLSLTRDKQFAINWGAVVFELDQEKLKHQFKIIPYNWGYHIAMSKNQNHKKEREEFLVTSSERVSFGPSKSKQFMDFIKKPFGKSIPLNVYCKSITLSKSAWEIYTDNGKRENKIISKIMNHPLYVGMDDRCK